jgi:outer membrane protein OmpA-like peptidoglycan-associated protein
MNHIRSAATDVSHGTYAHRTRSKGLFWWILGALAVALFAWQMLRNPRARTGTEAPRVMQDTTRTQQPTIVPQGAPEQMASAATVAGGAAALTVLLTNDDPLPAKMQLDQVQFASGSSALSSNRALDDMATALKSHEGARIRLEGFADATGTPATNQQLSRARAQSVKDYLVAEGVPADNIEVVGRAADQPAASNDSASGRADNRRVELTLLSR